MDDVQSGQKRGAEAVLSIPSNSSISIAYHPQFGPHDDLMLLELDEKLIPDILNQRISLRGNPGEDAVLCSHSKTFAVKFVGTSNSVFLIPPSDESETLQDRNEIDHRDVAVASVLKVAPGVMEIVEVAPKLDKLKFLLSRCPYTFDEASEEDGIELAARKSKQLYGWDDLVDMIQASDEEIRNGLQALSAVDINGYWRILDESYMDSILNMLLHNIILNDWSLTALNEDKVVGMLEVDGYHRTIARHCLQVYGNKLDDGSCTWKLDERRVCLHFAREILRGKKMKLESFMEEWTRKVPDGMFPTYDMLEGEVLTERIGVETLVYAFSVSSLPSTPADRFSILFRERLKWEWKDLQPYVRDLRVPGLTSEGILLKYTRRTQPTADAEPIFSPR